MRIITLACTAFLCISRLFAQNNYPEHDFIPPLDIPLFLAGNFGELRSNHYHSGLDLKTDQHEGLKVFSVANGYISRIKISHFGYGKVIYVTHPNGYTTVYGHIQKFSKDIQDYIVKKQYEKESYEIELFPNYDELPVKQGDVIAFSGNTGSSGGPHLHFEVRDTHTENVINPLLFGINIKDTSPPVLENMVAYTLDGNAQINGKQGTIQLSYTKQKDGSYITNKIKATGNIAFGLKAFDRQDGAYNQNGIYSIEVLVNGTKYIDLDFETFSFAESGQINTYIDYKKFANSGQRFQKTYIDEGNNLSIYNHKLNKGFIAIEEGKDYTMTVLLKDYLGNTTQIYVPVKGEALAVAAPVTPVKTDYYLVAKRDNLYEFDNASVYFPANTFYGNLYLEMKYLNGELTVHNKEVPVSDYYSISFDVSKMKDSLNLSKYFIGNYNYNGVAYYQTTKLKNKVLTARTKTLGKFKLIKDVTPPVVKPFNFKGNQWISNYNYLIFKISDDLSGIKDYRATIDGKWVLTEYEYKDGTLTYNCNDLTFEGSQHNLELTVTDNVGNSTTFTTTFFRKY